MAERLGPVARQRDLSDRRRRLALLQPERARRQAEHDAARARSRPGETTSTLGAALV